MTIRELDRLVSATELTPLNKKALRSVRKAVVSGRVGDVTSGTATWTVAFDSDGGSQVHMKFSLKRD